MNGLHIISDCYGCDFNSFSGWDQAQIGAYIVSLVEKVGLSPLGVCTHIFADTAFTLCVILGESHISLHTWPEFSHVSLDIFVCNSTADHSAQARELLALLHEVFLTDRHSTHEYIRSLIG